MDEPIHARPPTAWDRLVKWTRRAELKAATECAGNGPHGPPPGFDG